MRYITDINEIQESGSSVVTLGKFDGIHRGHRKIFRCASALAEERGAGLSVFTFAVSPQAVLSGKANRVLVTATERREMIEAAGAGLLAECRFDEELRNMEAEDFIREILMERLHAAAVVKGEDFRFGKGRKGDNALLAAYGRQYGFAACAVEKEKDGAREISSTYIREEVEAGHMEKAGALLGYDFFISGTVVSGQRLGRTIGFPTANLIPAPEKIMPPYGVYSTRTEVRGRVYKSITDIGMKPTVNGDACGVETFLMDFDDDIYGEEIRVSLLHFMRGERKFASVDELAEQLQRDIKEREDYEK